MKKHLILLLYSVVAAVMLSGCGGVFEREYVVIDEYIPAVSDKKQIGNSIMVASYEELCRTLSEMVDNGILSGSIVFDTTYEGDLAEDMASACWEVRTQDALCAYRVANIAYELSKIVTFSEASVSVRYSQAAVNAEEIVRIQFSAEVDELLQQAMNEGKKRLAVLINQSLFSQEDMVNEVGVVYREMPSLAPREPKANVYMFSGTGAQRLYEINLDYGVSDEELAAFHRKLGDLSPLAELDAENIPDWLLAFHACEYLKENCRVSQSIEKNGIADALLTGEANSEGFAFAYVELCHRLGLECQVIYGQRNWQDHCWNLVKIDDSYYHVDVQACAESELNEGFMLTDESAWNLYRWNVAAYPPCEGELEYARLRDAIELEQVQGEEGTEEEKAAGA